MGLLDDAIREHLELKRLRGADPADVARMEREALGPGRRPEPGLDPLADPLLDPEYDSGAAASDAPFDDEPAASGPADAVAPDSLDARDFEEHIDPAQDPWAQSEEPPAAVAGSPEPPPPYSQETVQYDVEPGLVDMPQADAAAGAVSEAAVPERPSPDPVAAAPPAPDEPGPYVEVLPASSEPAAPAEAEGVLEPPAPVPAEPVGDEGPLGGERAEEPGTAPPAEAAEGEDVLEETPDFLQETPEHERLWFEQRPPRDFDFDK